MWYVWERGEMHTGFWWGNLRERDHVERPRCRWEYNIKMALQDVGCEGMDGIDLTQDRDRWRTVVNTAMNIRFP
jgi:hypothetical protein